MSNLRFPKPWDIVPAGEVTPEQTFLDRRSILKKLGFSGVGLLGLLGGRFENVEAASYGPYGHVPEFWVKQWADLFPAVRNEKFKVDLPITDERLFAAYNNFYEFTLIKERVRMLVEGFKADPWQVEVTGEIEKKGKYDLDDLIRIGKLEERVYHHRCVEAWSANVPWTGFPLRQLIEHVQPTDRAKYIRFITVLRPTQMPGQRDRSYPWPYYEALTMEEGMNDLALLTFGVYGHPLNKQNGAPVRMVLPWKYGFKSIKSIVKIEFTRRQPGTLWSDSSREYGFYGNVNPGFDHPRWSQASERFLNTGERIPTQIYNGYAEQVGHLYDASERKYFY
ncbi:MAG: protein-methionine-sulfoxide reductase catalytic subunit MsrP [Acidobacteriota bacterium]|nr:MAG: protein-methionine-sulfoxide reductase catalytic subunit MsrP [Acidobacteriota bacterium]